MLAALLCAVGCGAGPPGGATASATATRLEAVGIVTAVEGSSPSEVTRFTLRTADGKTLSFELGTLETARDAFPAGHLREHQVSAEPVRVTYRVEQNRVVAVRLADAR